MKKFTGHKEDWGTFVDVKINAAELLEKEIRRKKKAQVRISGVCDPYQPLEEQYRLTRQCLEILIREDWPVVMTVLNKIERSETSSYYGGYGGYGGYGYGQ